VARTSPEDTPPRLFCPARFAISCRIRTANLVAVRCILRYDDGFGLLNPCSEPVLSRSGCSAGFHTRTGACHVP
jgi:hypothetical protein